jgi:transcriptional antiterminator RfaH
MDWVNDLNWFAVQTKPHHEQLAAAHVAKLDLEIFLPKIKREELVCGVRREVVRALFPGYLFAKFSLNISFDAVRYSSGVVRVVGTSRFPVPIEPAMIAALRCRVQGDGFVLLERRRFHSGDAVVVEKGPFAGWIGKLEREWDDGRRVLVLLEAIQQARLVIEERWLVAASV